MVKMHQIVCFNWSLTKQNYSSTCGMDGDHLGCGYKHWRGERCSFLVLETFYLTHIGHG